MDIKKIARMSTTPLSRPSDALAISLSLSQDRRFWEERGLSTLKHAGLCVCVFPFFCICTMPCNRRTSLFAVFIAPPRLWLTRGRKELNKKASPNAMPFQRG